MGYPELINFLTLSENRDFLKKIKKQNPSNINAIARLIKNNPHKPVKEILTQIRIQDSLKGKIDKADNYIFTEKSAQQCSSSSLAEYHSSRLHNYGAIADLCCGAGMDLIKIAVGKRKVWAVDLDEEVLKIAQFNSKTAGIDRIKFVRGKAEDFMEEVDAVFIDPDRRAGNKRFIDIEDYAPSFTQILEMQKRFTNILCKFSPALKYKSLKLNIPYSWEFVSQKRSLKEALLSLGGLASPENYTAAVMVDQNARISSSEPVKTEIAAIGKYLFEPDPAVIRGGLVQQLAYKLNLCRIDPKLALLTGDKTLNNPWIISYKVIDIQKYNIKEIKSYLRKHEIGDLIIKTRGFPERVETFRKKFKLTGRNKIVMFILRIGDKHTIVFAKLESKDNVKKLRR